MANEVSLPVEFREVMKEKILTAFMGMIPQDKIEEMINKEISSFFNEESFLVICESQASIKKRQSMSYSSSSTPPSSFSIESKMTPFRQLAWSTIYAFIEPKLTEIINDAKGQAKQELDKLLVEEYKPKAEETFKAIFTETAKSMSATMFYKTMSMSIDSSHFNMLQTLRTVGINPPDSSSGIMKPIPLN